MTMLDDRAPYGTSLLAALGLGTPGGWPVMGMLLLCWWKAAGAWLLLLAIPVAILALPWLRDVRGRMAVMTRVGVRIPRERWRSDSAWLNNRFLETMAIAGAIFMGWVTTGLWTLVPFTLLAVFRMRWLNFVPAMLIVFGAALALYYWPLPTRFR